MKKTRCALPVLLLLAFAAGCAEPLIETEADLIDRPTYTTWETYLGDPTSSQYSVLDQLTPDEI